MMLLDLFCCAGGAGVGYARAGFTVYGVDREPQPHYPFPFHQGDAIEVLRELLAGRMVDFTHPDGTVEWVGLRRFVAVHASPPCQLYSTSRHTHANEHPDLVDPTRDLLIETGLPYIIENVPGAPLRDPLVLCGSEFGLRALDVDGVELAMRRHRLFESNVWLMGAGGCSHDDTIVAGSYKGVHAKFRRPEGRDDPNRKGGYTPAVPVRAALMGISWMNEHELAQAIPPAYTGFLGEQLARAIAQTPDHMNGGES